MKLIWVLAGADAGSPHTRWTADRPGYGQGPENDGRWLVGWVREEPQAHRKLPRQYLQKAMPRRKRGIIGATSIAKQPNKQPALCYCYAPN